jgi:uncharacterized protein YaaR (DUF327 family)
MKVSNFKKIIKECVREVLREEITNISKSEINENIHFTSNQVNNSNKTHLASLFNSLPKIGGNLEFTQSPTESTGNIYLDMIKETAANMTPQEMAQMRQQY